jgi:hypothetical protein
MQTGPKKKKKKKKKNIATRSTEIFPLKVLSLKLHGRSLLCLF